VLPKKGAVARLIQREREMIDFNPDLRAHRIAALVFAFLSGVSAISVAVAPAITNF